MQRIYKHTPTIKAARVKFTLILLALLSLGYYVKADVPCSVAIELQQSTIDSLQYQLSIATSKPYNQGYQDGYKASQTTADNAAIVICLLCGVVYICLILYFYIFYLKK
jgi:hypothetical protein